MRSNTRNFVTLKLKYNMRFLNLAFTVFVTATTTVMTSCNTQNSPAVQDTTISKDSLIKRGNYLVATIGCDDCHSPKRMGAMGPEIIPELRLSGYPQNRQLPPVDSAAMAKGWVLIAPDLTAAAGPWGVTFSSNITGDTTGIGTWTEAQFINALRKGKLKGLDNARPLLPPMPWQNLAKLSDLDMKSIYTYLLSIPAVKNIVPQPILNH